jgi:non-ribosomal peptide synthetase component F
LSGNLPVPSLPLDRPRPAVLSLRGASQSLLLSLELSEALKALSRRERVAPFMTLLAAFQTLLYRQTEQENIAAGSRKCRSQPGRNRAADQTSPTPQFFSPTCRTIPVLELLGRERLVALEAYAHQDLPFEKLVEELRTAGI